jgi:prepilin-type N-terminal cleavage/methylation domain-containing protein
MKTKSAFPRPGGRRGARAFTIIEIMIVVGIIALLASIAIPYFVTYRASAQAKVCVSNLKQIEAAKEQWALEYRKTTGDAVDMTDLVGVNSYIKSSVSCPGNDGDYIVGAVGTPAKCPLSGQLPTHALP